MRTLQHPDQTDFFERPVFAPRQKADRLDAELFRLRMKQAMSRSLTRSGQERESIAAAMAEVLGQPSLSKTMLDAYTSPAKSHDISLVRFKALAWVTGDSALWDAALSDEGLTVLAGDEPRLAELARLQQLRRQLNSKIARLTAVPVRTGRL